MRKPGLLVSRMIHGTNTGYRAGCRCDACRDAQRDDYRGGLRKPPRVYWCTECGEPGHNRRRHRTETPVDAQSEATPRIS